MSKKLETYYKICNAKGEALEDCIRGPLHIYQKRSREKEIDIPDSASVGKRLIDDYPLKSRGILPDTWGKCFVFVNRRRNQDAKNDMHAQMHAVRKYGILITNLTSTLTIL